MPTKFQELPEDEALKVERLWRALDTFREIDTAIPASYMVAFLLVALEPGKGSSYYAAKMGLDQAVVSRIILEIGKKARRGGDGLGLIDSEASPEDLRARMNFLTPKGKQLLRRILVSMGRER